MRAVLAACTAVALTFSVLTMADGVSAASPANPARNSTVAAAQLAGPCQMFSRVRLLDSRRTGLIAPGGTAQVQVPEPDYADVIGASVNVTVLNPTGSGSATLFAHGTRWSGATLSFQAGHTIQNFETVPVDGRGLIDIRNNSAVRLALIVDLLGFCLDQGASQGLYEPIAPTRVLDTRSGQPVGPGQTRNILAAHLNPPRDQDAIINFTVLTPSRSGSLSVGAGSVGTHNTPSISFVAGQTEQSQLTMDLNTNGTLPIRNNSAAAIQVIADVVGYYADPGGSDGDAFIAANHYSRAFDSRAAGTGAVPPGGTVTIPVHKFDGSFGAGITLKMAAVSMNVTVLTPRADGAISVWPSGVAWDGAATVSFTAGQTRQRMLLAMVGSDLDLQIRNDTNVPLTLIVDLNGELTSYTHR